jgi:predicted nucleic acid-binding protein
MSGAGKYLYDTDVIIDYMKGEEKAKHLLEGAEGKQCLSVITVSELYAGVRNMRDKGAVQGLSEYFEVIDINRDIATRAGLWKKDYHKSHNVLLPDALIAATAYQHGLELKTLNVKHYPMIEGLKPAYTKYVLSLKEGEEILESIKRDRINKD